jgi:hypothetical protein
MGLGIGIANAIPFGERPQSIISSLIASLCARATYCENKPCTIATLEKLENIT